MEQGGSMKRILSHIEDIEAKWCEKAEEKIHETSWQL